MKRLIPISTILVYLALIIVLHADERPCTIVWHTSSDVFNDWYSSTGFHAFMGVQPAKAKPVHFINTYQFALCSSDFTRSLKLTFHNLNIGDGYSGIIGQFGQEKIDEIKKLGDGTYHAGFIIDDRRCSNVGTFSINSSRPLPSGPSIQVIGISDLDRDVISSVALWVTPPDHPDSVLLYSSIVYPDLVIDGVRYHPKAMVWAGPNGPLKPHTTDGAIASLSNYDPAITLSDHYSIQVIIGSYKSPVTTLSLDRSVEKKFDSYFKIR